MQNKYTYFFFLAGIIVFTIGFRPEFIGFDCRFAVFAKEMLRNGPTFFPTIYGQPYPDYPGTSTLLIYLISLPFGKVTHFTAVLPTAVVSALILVFIYKIGALHSRKWGSFAVLFALFTIEFFSYSRSISPDQYVTLATVMCFYIVYSATVYHRQKSLWIIPFLFISGFIFRGPIGLIIPASVVCDYYLYNRDFANFAFTASAAGVLLIIYTFMLLAAAQFQGGETFVKQVIQAQVTGRISGNAKHWMGYYFTESFGRYALSYPFAVFIIVVLYKKIFTSKNGEYKLLASLVIWMMVVLVGMSVPSARKIRYVLPIIPAVALVGSYLFIYPFQKNVLSGVERTFIGLCSWFPLGVVVFSLAAWMFSEKIESLFGANYLISVILAFLLAIISWVLNIRLKNDDKKDFALLIVGTITFIIVMICIIEPVDYYHSSTNPFASKIKILQSQEPGQVVFYKIGADSEAIKFMANYDMPLKPRFINNPEDMLDFNFPVYFIAMKGDYETVPKNITTHIRLLDFGKIGHDECAIFTCRSK